MNNLYDKLLYNWERGFYSVVYSSVNGYGMVTTKTSTGSLWFSGWHNERKVVETRIGLYPLEIQNEGKGIEIVDTIHPSELMGKGFQVGDKVKVPRIDGSCEVIKASSGNKDAYEVKLPINYSDMPSQFFTSSELKPVLPVEEKKEDPLKGIMTLQQYHELADLADNFMSKFKSVKDGSLSSKEREACKIVNL